MVHAATKCTYGEYDPFECVKTNVIGAECIDACIDKGVGKSCAINDKASSPAIYTARKLTSDPYYSANSYSGDRLTTFSVVRYKW